MSKTDSLCRKLNYKFQNSALLKQALTHCSAGNENNERLEFLGDSLLNLIITEALYHKFPFETEGKLSRLRATLVKGETLAKIAKDINIGDYLYLGQGELKSGGFRRESILADALEAIFAAIHLDGGIAECKKVILYLYTSRLDDTNLVNNLKDPKTQLQEFLQSNKLPLPIYTLTKTIEKNNEQIFCVTCTIPDKNLIAKGSGANRKKAEQIAAEIILNKMQVLPLP